MHKYFNHESFLLRLKTEIDGKYTIRDRTIKGEPLRYKISGSPSDFAFIQFIDTGVEVRVNINFSWFSSKQFMEDITKRVKNSMD